MLLDARLGSSEASSVGLLSMANGSAWTGGTENIFEDEGTGLKGFVSK